MAAPTLTNAAGGAAAGSLLIPGIGTAIGAAIGFLSGVFGNNDNAVISARDKIVKKFRANTAGAASSDLFPIKKSDGGILFSKFNLEHSQIDDRKIGGNYDKEWVHVAEFGATLLMLMYPGNEVLVGDYVNLIKNKQKPDHAFASIVNFNGQSLQTSAQLRGLIGMDESVNVATDANPTGQELAFVRAETETAGGGSPWYKNPIVWVVGLVVLLLLGKKLLRL